MRASVSHTFGRDFKQGDQSWIEISPGRFIGNPSMAFEVSTYMISLRRRKVSAFDLNPKNTLIHMPQVRLGEVVTSARAMDADVLHKLYEFNYQAPDNVTTSKKKRKADELISDWAGKEPRIMLQALYLISFLCLLRYDEALRIEWHWLDFLKVDGQRCLKVSLPFRKTHQTGSTSYAAILNQN